MTLDISALRSLCEAANYDGQVTDARRREWFEAMRPIMIMAALDEIERLRACLCKRCGRTCPHNCATPPADEDIHEMRAERDAYRVALANLLAASKCVEGHTITLDHYRGEARDLLKNGPRKETL